MLLRSTLSLPSSAYRRKLTPITPNVEAVNQHPARSAHLYKVPSSSSSNSKEGLISDEGMILWEAVDDSEINYCPDAVTTERKHVRLHRAKEGRGRKKRRPTREERTETFREQMKEAIAPEERKKNKHRLSDKFSGKDPLETVTPGSVLSFYSAKSHLSEAENVEKINLDKLRRNQKKHTSKRIAFITVSCPTTTPSQSSDDGSRLYNQQHYGYRRPKLRPCETSSEFDGLSSVSPFETTQSLATRPRSSSLSRRRRPRKLHLKPPTSTPGFLDPKGSNLLGVCSTSIPVTVQNFLHELEYGGKLAEEDYTCSTGGTTATYPPIKGDFDDKVIVINVAGEIFLLKYILLVEYPDSLLGSDELFDYYVEALHSFFFDRNRFLFEFVVQFYQTGTICIPIGTNKTIVRELKREFEFFRIKYSFDVLEDNEEIPIERQKREAKMLIAGLDVELGRWVTRKLALFLFLTNPQSSLFAMLWTAVDITFVVFSMFCLFLESEHDFHYIFMDPTNPYYKIIAAMEILIQIFFTLDFILRLISWPSKNTMRGVKTFFTNGSNICDLISLLPFYLPQLLSLLDNRNVKSLVVLRIIRTFRVARIFRMVRHSRHLRFVFDFLLCKNLSDLLIMAELFFLMMLLFSTLMYFFEGKEHMVSIPNTMWWCVCTLTGIGYGDVYPKTNWGKVIASITMMSGIIFLALPLSIILHEFAKHMRSKGFGFWKGLSNNKRGYIGR